MLLLLLLLLLLFAHEIINSLELALQRRGIVRHCNSYSYLPYTVRLWSLDFGPISAPVRTIERMRPKL